MLPSYSADAADYKGVCRQIVANPSERVTTDGDSQQSTHHILTWVGHGSCECQNR